MANPYKNTGRAGSNSPANIINPKKAAYKLAQGFFNTAKQYYKAITKPKAIKQQTPRKGYFKPFHRDGKIYGRKEIDQAFKNRFGPDAVPSKPLPKINTVTKKKGMFGGTSYGTDVTPSKTTNFGRADAVVKMREMYRNLRNLND